MPFFLLFRHRFLAKLTNKLSHQKMRKIWIDVIKKLNEKSPALIRSPMFHRYLVVGLLNTLFGYSIFALLIYLGISYSISLLLATILGVLFNFKSIGILVFKSRNNRLISRFTAVYIIIYLLNLAGLKLLTVANVNIYVAGAMLLPLMAVVGFLINKRFVFIHE